MKRTTLVFCLVAANITASPQPPNITQVVGQTFNFAAGIQGDTLQYGFTITNTTDKPETITSVTSSCGCTTITSFPQQVPAKGSSVIECRTILDKIGSKDVSITVQIQGLPSVLFATKGTIVGPALSNPAKIDPSVFIEPKDAINAKDVLFLDVRPSNVFDLVHEAHAQSAPLATGLVARSYLSKKNLVLVGSGTADQDLMPAIKNCLKAGFVSIRILRGGIRLWQQQHCPLAGVLSNRPPIDHISCSDLVSSAQTSTWVLLVPVTEMPTTMPSLCKALGYSSDDQLISLLATFDSSVNVAVFGHSTLITAESNAPTFFVSDSVAKYIEQTRIVALQKAQAVSSIQNADWAHRIKNCPTCP